MKKIKEYINRHAWLFMIVLFGLYGVTATTVYNADKFLANKVVAIKNTDTTTLYYPAYGNLYFKKTGTDTTYYLSNGRTAANANKFFRVWPDTFANAGVGSPELVNPSTGRFLLKSYSSIDGLGVTSDASNIYFSIGRSDSVVTSSTSITTIQTIGTVSNTSGIIDLYVQGILSDGSDAAYVKNTIYYKNVAGTVTLTTPGGQLAPAQGAGLGTPAYTLSASGTNILVRVTAGNATSTKWRVTSMKIQNITTP